MAVAAATNENITPTKMLIGLNDFIEAELEFYWDDQSKTDYFNWGPREPDASGEEDPCNPSYWAVL